MSCQQHLNYANLHSPCSGGLTFPVVSNNFASWLAENKEQLLIAFEHRQVEDLWHLLLSQAPLQAEDIYSIIETICSLRNDSHFIIFSGQEVVSYGCLFAFLFAQNPAESLKLTEFFLQEKNENIHLFLMSVLANLLPAKKFMQLVKKGLGKNFQQVRVFKDDLYFQFCHYFFTDEERLDLINYLASPAYSNLKMGNWHSDFFNYLMISLTTLPPWSTLPMATQQKISEKTAPLKERNLRWVEAGQLWQGQSITLKSKADFLLDHFFYAAMNQYFAQAGDFTFFQKHPELFVDFLRDRLFERWQEPSFQKGLQKMVQAFQVSEPTFRQKIQSKLLQRGEISALVAKNFLVDTPILNPKILKKNANLAAELASPAVMAKKAVLQTLLETAAAAKPPEQAWAELDQHLDQLTQIDSSWSDSQVFHNFCQDYLPVFPQLQQYFKTRWEKQPHTRPAPLQLLALAAVTQESELLNSLPEPAPATYAPTNFLFALRKFPPAADYYINALVDPQHPYSKLFRTDFLTNSSNANWGQINRLLANRESLLPLPPQNRQLLTLLLQNLNQEPIINKLFNALLPVLINSQEKFLSPREIEHYQVPIQNSLFLAFGEFRRRKQQENRVSKML